MKKILLTIALCLSMLVMAPQVKAENQVNIYLFTQKGCNACEYALETLADMQKQHPGLFEVYNIQVWNGWADDGSWILGSEELQNLLLTVKERLGNEEGIATPTIALGDYIQVGASDLEAFIERMETFRDAENPRDVVKEVADEMQIDLEPYHITTDENEGKYDAIIIIGIFVILIGGFAGLIVMSKK